MKVKNLLVILVLALAAGCGGGGDSNNGNTPTASQAFVAAVQTVAATEPDDSEPADISASKEATDDDAEAVVLK